MEDWMQESITSDVQTAIQSSVVQTALEANTSKISDAGFQSFLTNAPIPRASSLTPTGTYAGGAATTTIIWTVSTYHDPYSIFDKATGFGTIPIDGYYSMHFSMSAAGTAGSCIRIYWDINGSPYGEIAANDILGTGEYRTSTAMVFPLVAGYIIKCNVINHGAAALTIRGGAMGLSWAAPYNRYTSSAGGS